MAYEGMQQTNPVALPRTIDPSASLIELNPLPPPGRPLDGTADLHPARHGHYEAVQHTYTVELGGTISTDGEWSITITPVKTGLGVAVADAFEPITINATVGATETATALGDLFVAAALAASTISSHTGINSVTRLAEVATVTNDAGTLTIKAVNAGATFTISTTQEAGGTATATNTVDADKANLRIGVFVVRDGVAADGFTPIVRLPASGDTASMLYGVVADGNRAVAIDPEAGYTYRAYRPGRDVPILPLEGAITAFAEAAVDYGDEIWVRAVATGSEQAGAANDTPDFVAQIVTVTPTAADATQYKGSVQVYDADGKLLATTLYDFTSGAGTNATLICDGIRIDLNAGSVADYITMGGTDTLTLTAKAAGYNIVYSPSGAGVEDPVLTEAGSTDHLKLPKGKFARTITAAGTCAIDYTL